MGGSQLKQLKTSLRENGILGPQKSKKQRQASDKDASKRIQRHAALESIRERFNPFEAKVSARKNKFDIASNKPTKQVVERPGVTRGLGEEKRRATLLKEMQSRNKIGGMLDRRFGEDDPNMTPEQKAAERFAQQVLRTSRKSDMFNLEDNSEDEVLLTHGGRALSLGEEDNDNSVARDDFDEDVEVSEADEFEAQNDRPRKRMRLEDGENGADENGEDDLQRRKSKHEVMQEVIAKSKMYKAARQAAKEDDDELRMELDKGMGEFYQVLRSHAPSQKQLPSPPGTDSEPVMDPSRAAMLAGKSREEAEKEYEANLRELKLEARSKPSKRTKTEEEKAAEEKARLEDLERKRLKRMRGEADSSDEDDVEEEIPDVDEERDDAEAFGLQQPEARYIPQLAVEDEDEFVMDDIIASGSDAEFDSGDSEESSEFDEPQDDGDDDFINGLVLPPKPSTKTQNIQAATRSPSMAYTFPCPQTLDEFLETFKDVPAEGLPTAVQRVRALYHKGLANENQEKLAKFAGALLTYIVYSVNRTSEQQLPMLIGEQLIRHLHSMAKSQPYEVGLIFREYLRGFQGHELPPLHAGDLIIFTAIATIFPTSDQWHTVVTPAMLIIARYLAQDRYETPQDLAKGIYLCSLALRYQRNSNRYIPETINFICRGLEMVAPNDSRSSMKLDTLSAPSCGYRITERTKGRPLGNLKFDDLRLINHDFEQDEKDPIDSETLLQALLKLVTPTIDQYRSKTAFPELITPILHIFTDRLDTKATRGLLHSSTRELVQSTKEAVQISRDAAISTRKPLLLHNHKPLAIKMSYPAFQDDYNPERKYHDPDRERSELNKLKAEHKKERKGAMRELRKDANFMAREQLREKKARDEAYDKKFKRLVADIQGEEGREAKEYEREKAKRKGRF